MGAASCVQTPFTRILVNAQNVVRDVRLDSLAIAAIYYFIWNFQMLHFELFLTRKLIVDVTSLVRSSTLVIAGIYLIIWYGNWLNMNYKGCISLFSGITIFISVVIANFEIDFEKIIALSILS